MGALVSRSLAFSRVGILLYAFYAFSNRSQHHKKLALLGLFYRLFLSVRVRVVIRNKFFLSIVRGGRREGGNRRVAVGALYYAWRLHFFSRRWPQPPPGAAIFITVSLFLFLLFLFFLFSRVSLSSLSSLSSLLSIFSQSALTLLSSILSFTFVVVFMWFNIFENKGC